MLEFILFLEFSWFIFTGGTNNDMIKNYAALTSAPVLR